MPFLNDDADSSSLYLAQYVSEKGSRDYQQDSALVVSKDESEQALVVVCDGVGGRSGGADASKAATETIEKKWQESDGISQDPATMLRRFVLASHHAVNALVERPKDAPHSTIVVLYLQGQEAHWAHLGDSRLYHLRDGAVLNRTRDHSVAEILCRQGEITDEEIGTHPDQSRLLRFLGGEEIKKVYTGCAAVGQGDAFLLCTDGFWTRLTDIELGELSRVPRREAFTLLSRLVKAAICRSGPKADNVTAVLVKAGDYPERNRSALRRVLTGVSVLLLAGLATFIIGRSLFGFDRHMHKDSEPDQPVFQVQETDGPIVRDTVRITSLPESNQ